MGKEHRSHPAAPGTALSTSKAKAAGGPSWPELNAGAQRRPTKHSLLRSQNSLQLSPPPSAAGSDSDLVAMSQTYQDGLPRAGQPRPAAPGHRREVRRALGREHGAPTRLDMFSPDLP